ncbi:MAG: sensor histidine kinase [Spirochaetales bacterium]
MKKMNNREKRNPASIQTLVVMGLVIGATMLIAVMGITYYAYNRTMQEKKVARDNENLCDQFAASLEYPVWNFDATQVRIILESAFLNESVAAIALNAEQMRYSFVSDSEKGSRETIILPPIGNRIVGNRSITHKGAPIGTLTIYSDIGVVLAKLNSDLFFFGSIIAALDIFLIASLFILLRAIILRPLGVLEQYARLYEPGSARPPFGKTKFFGELASLRASIEKMASLLEQRYAELQRAAATLGENRKFLDDVVQNIPAMIFVKDAENLAFVQLNKTGEALLGYSFAELAGKNDRDFFPADQADFFIRMDKNCLAEGKLIDIPEERIFTKTQGERILHTRKIPLADTEGKPKYLLGISEDITEKKDIERQLRDLNATLEQRVAERTAVLEVLNKELETFSYSVSHDLRTPLRAIEGFSQLLSQEYSKVLDSEGKRRLNTIIANAKKMEALIAGLLALSRASKGELKFSKIDMNKVVAELCDELLDEKSREEYSLIVNDLPPAWGDSTLIRQALENLLSNAIKYSGKSQIKTIEIGASSAQGFCTYYIKDHGAGFDPEYSGKLFKAFERLHGQKEFEGVGIGLAIVKSIIARHGGFVRAEGAPDQGATFYFSLPLRSV